MSFWNKLCQELWSSFFAKTAIVAKNNIELDDEIILINEPVVAENDGIEPDGAENEGIEPVVAENGGIEPDGAENDGIGPVDENMPIDEAEEILQLMINEPADGIWPMNQNEQSENDDPDYVPPKKVVLVGGRFRPQRVLRAPIRFGDYAEGDELDRLL